MSVLRLGWEVLPETLAMAASAMSRPSSDALRIEAAWMPAVSCVWKWIGIPISCLSARTSVWAA